MAPSRVGEFSLEGAYGAPGSCGGVRRAPWRPRRCFGPAFAGAATSKSWLRLCKSSGDEEILQRVGILSPRRPSGKHGTKPSLCGSTWSPALFRVLLVSESRLDAPTESCAEGVGCPRPDGLGSGA